MLLFIEEQMQLGSRYDLQGEGPREARMPVKKAKKAVKKAAKKK
jgi:hypothetical protein